MFFYVTVHDDTDYNFGKTVSQDNCIVAPLRSSTIDHPILL